MKRVVMVEIEASNAMQVGRVADMIADEVKMSITFMQSTYEHFAQEAGVGTADDPPPAFPTITVTNMRSI